MKANPEELGRLHEAAKTQNVLLLYGARDEKHNNAVALKEVLETHSVEKKS